MTIMKARDLPLEARQMVLAQVRKQLGNLEYDRLVDAVGEDGVIDVILEKAGSSSGGADKKESGGSWGLPIAIGVVLVAAAAVGYVRAGWSGAKDYLAGVFSAAPAVWGALLVYAQLYTWIGQAFASSDQLVGNRSAATPAGLVHAVTLVLIAILAGAIALVAVSVPYVGAGIGTWWSWLIAHFR